MASEIQGYRLGECLLDARDLITELRTRDDGILFASTISGKVEIYDVANRTQAASFSLLPPNDTQPMSCTAMDISKDLLVAGSNLGNTGIWSISQQSSIAVWSDHTEKITSLSLPTSEQLYTTSHDGYFRVRDLAHDHLQHSVQITQSPLTAHATLAQDLVVIADMCGTARIIDLRAQNIVMNMVASEHETSPIKCLTAAPVAPGKKTKYALESADPNAKLLLYVGHGDGSVLSWDLRFPKVVCGSYYNSEEAVNAMAVYNGKLYSGGDDCSVQVCDAAEGTHMDVLGGMQSWVSRVATQEHLLFAADMLGQVRLYDTQEVALNIVRRQLEKEAKEDLARENALRLKELARKMRKKKKKAAEKVPTYTRRL